MLISQFLWRFLWKYRAHTLSASLTILAISVGLAYQPQNEFRVASRESEVKTHNPQLATSNSQLSTPNPQRPMYFIENQGQTDENVRYYIQGADHSVFFTDNGMVLNIIKKQADAANSEADPSIETVSYEEESPTESPFDKGGYRGIAPETSSGLALKFSFVGAGSQRTHESRSGHALGSLCQRGETSLTTAGVRPIGTKEKKGTVNYFIGNDPENWKRNIPTYSEIAYKNLYEGIDLIYKGEQGRLKYDLVVKPGAEISQIRFACEGAEGLSVADTGDLVIKTAVGELRDTKPYSYQVIDGEKVNVACNFRIHKVGAIHELPLQSFVYGFEVTSYDKNYPLIIDPTLVYSTFLGGSGSSYGDIVQGIAVDASGNIYVTGYTDSTNFPKTPGAYDTTHNGGSDAFVSKLAPTSAGSLDLIYSTVLGGSDTDAGGDIAVDASGNAYVTGWTWARRTSIRFPTTPGAYDTTHNGSYADVFVTKLSPSGSNLIYSTYIGGTASSDTGRAIAIDESGNAYITGWASTNYPTTTGAYDSSYGGAYVSKLDPSGSSLLYSTFLRANVSWDIAVDASGNIYVTGYTSNASFPTTPGAHDTGYNGGRDAFVTKLVPLGSGYSDFIYSTFLGGSAEDIGYGIALDDSGNAYVSGRTKSSGFPTTPGAYDTGFNGSIDAFVTKLDATGSSLLYSTFLGGSGSETARRIAVNTSGKVYVTGYTTSSGFPTTADAHQGSFSGGTKNDAFVTKLQLLGLTAEDIIYSTFLGGTTLEDTAYDITLLNGSAEDLVYLTGYTKSNNFSTTPGAYDTTYNGGNGDVFVSVFSFPVSTPQTCVAPHDINLSGYCATLGGTVEDNPVTPVDALIILGLAVGSITPDMLQPALTPAAAAIIGDGNGNGTLESVDALIALGVAVGSIPPVAPDPRCVPSSDISGACP